MLLLDLSYNKQTIEYIKEISNFFVNIDNHDMGDGIDKLDYVYITVENRNKKQKKIHATIAGAWKFFYPNFCR